MKTDRLVTPPWAARFDSLNAELSVRSALSYASLSTPILSVLSCSTLLNGAEYVHSGQNGTTEVSTMQAMSRALCGLTMIGMLLAAAAAVSAADEPHKGKVKSASAEKLVLTHGDQDHTFKIDETTKITLDGKEAKATDLKAGDSATVTAKQAEGGGMLATKIEATRGT